MKSRLFMEPLPFAGMLRAHLAIGTGRLLIALLRLLGRGATSLPGKAALCLDPGLLGRLTAGRLVLLVTGTNGKTTTVRLICALLQAQGCRTVTNPSGANLDSGLTSTLLSHLRDLGGRDLRQLALVFEIDEAFYGKLAANLNPKVTVVTNFFRDQLDRFGELSHTRDLIARGLQAARGLAVLCADDSLCASLSRDLGFGVLTFGMDRQAMQPQPADHLHESSFCTFCGSRYEYGGMTYGHLGDFRCPNCGFARPAPDLVFRQTSQTTQDQTLLFRWQGEEAAVTLPIPGLHNGYNAAAAILAGVAAGLPFRASVAALGAAEAAFGRMERFAAEGRDVCLILVKNPIGMDRALEFVAAAPDAGGVMFLLNSNDPDGRDVSWIWDAHFEDHLPPGRIGVSGARCCDMALRLYYAGKAPADLEADGDHLALFGRVLAGCPAGRCLYVLPNYTAMLALRADLARRYRLREFWR